MARLFRRFAQHGRQPQDGIRLAAFQVDEAVERSQRPDGAEVSGQNAVAVHQPQHGDWIGGLQEAQQFVANPFRRDADELRRRGHRGSQTGRVRRAVAVVRLEAKEAQQAQIVLGDTLGRVADEAHASGPGIGDAVEIVGHLAVRGGEERVHGEVAAQRVLPPIVGEGDDRLAAVGFHVAPKGGDLEGALARDGRHRAVLEAGRHGLQPARLDGLQHRLRRGRGGEVDVAHRPAEHGVTHAAADEARLDALGGERCQHGLCRWGGHPRLIGQAKDLAHAKRRVRNYRRR